jgi:O-antigen ligase
VQWAAAWPLVKSNPIIGHGFATGGFDIGSSKDSYVISLLVETGVPGFLFFTGMAADLLRRPRLLDRLVGIWRLGGLACLASYRPVLSETEIHFLMFFLLGIVVMLNYGYHRKVAEETRSYRAQRTSYSRPQRPGLDTA